MRHLLNVLNSVRASTARRWRGSMTRTGRVQPAEPLRLFDCEGDAACRLVREALTELDLDAIILPCPDGGHRYANELENLSGSRTPPFLIDLDTDREAQGAEAILTYLFEHYADRPVPAALTASSANLAQSARASRIRGNAGRTVRRSQPARQLLTLYSFESSPYSRPVRERLCELELGYRLINLGKQQLADVGPAKLHLTLKPYRPLPGTKRAAFFARHGNVQVPYLEDPNTDTALFESADILAYLDRTYGG
jgi:glutathione S-transferase